MNNQSDYFILKENLMTSFEKSLLVKGNGKFEINKSFESDDDLTELSDYDEFKKHLNCVLNECESTMIFKNSGQQVKSANDGSRACLIQ